MLLAASNTSSSIFRVVLMVDRQVLANDISVMHHASDVKLKLKKSDMQAKCQDFLHFSVTCTVRSTAKRPILATGIGYLGRRSRRLGSSDSNPILPALRV